MGVRLSPSRSAISVSMRREPGARTATGASSTVTRLRVTAPGQAQKTFDKLAEVSTRFAEVRLRTWPGGADRLLAHSQWHGRWVRWQPEA